MDYFALLLNKWLKILLHGSLIKPLSLACTFVKNLCVFTITPFFMIRRSSTSLQAAALEKTPYEAQGKGNNLHCAKFCANEKSQSKGPDLFASHVHTTINRIIPSNSNFAGLTHGKESERSV